MDMYSSPRGAPSGKFLIPARRFRVCRNRSHLVVEMRRGWVSEGESPTLSFGVTSVGQRDMSRHTLWSGGWTRRHRMSSLPGAADLADGARRIEEPRWAESGGAPA